MSILANPTNAEEGTGSEYHSAYPAGSAEGARQLRLVTGAIRQWVWVNTSTNATPSHLDPQVIERLGIRYLSIAG